MADAASEPILTWPLDTPITAHGEKLTELSFRRPTAADIVKVGNPVKFVPYDPSSEPSIIDDRMATMMAVLASVNPGAILQLDPVDFNAIAWNLAGFFIARPWKRTSTSPST